jgi:hypothetical protein
MNNEDKNDKTKPTIEIWMEENHIENNIINDNASELCKKYIENIKNLIKIDEKMINNIRNMSNEDKMDIIIEFNNVIENLKVFIGKWVF